MNTKIATACLTAALIGSAAMLAHAQNYEIIAPQNCRVNNPGIPWCCWVTLSSGGLFVKEDVRYYSNGTVRTGVYPEPSCYYVLPP